MAEAGENLKITQAFDNWAYLDCRLLHDEPVLVERNAAHLAANTSVSTCRDERLHALQMTASHGRNKRCNAILHAQHSGTNNNSQRRINSNNEGQRRITAVQMAQRGSQLDRPFGGSGWLSEQRAGSVPPAVDADYRDDRPLWVAEVGKRAVLTDTRTQRQM